MNDRTTTVLPQTVLLESERALAFTRLTMDNRWLQGDPSVLMAALA